MSKEIKEKCKTCAYYNDKQQYPDVEGTTTHMNCLSVKCQYRKITKDMQIRGLTNKVSDLEAKLAESEKQIKRRVEVYEKQFIEQTDEIYQLKQQLAEKEEKIREINNELIHQEKWFKDIKSFNIKRDYAKPIFSQMQKYLNHYRVNEKFKVYCSNCGNWEEYEFKDITFNEMTYDIYIQCKNCPRSLNTSHFPEQAVFFYKFIADLGALQRMQDYSLIESLTCEKEYYNQDKIEFAVEQLEEVKTLLQNAVNFEHPEYDLIGVYDAINNQIKEIKGE